MTTPVAGRLYHRIGPRPLVCFGYAVLVYNTWELAHLRADTAIRWIAVLMGLRGLALGTTMQSTFTTALGAVPLPRVARGSSLVNARRNVVQTLGIAVIATLLASTLTVAMQAAEGRPTDRRTAPSAPALVLGLTLPRWPGPWSGRDGLLTES